MKSKIKSITGNGSWTHEQHGLFYSHEYTFEDGVTLVANSKNETSIHKIGDEVEYQITRTSAEHGNSGKVQKPQDEKFTGGQKSDKVQQLIVRQSSLTRAIEHLNHKTDDQMTKENITALAEYYADWVLKC